MLHIVSFAHSHSAARLDGPASSATHRLYSRQSMQHFDSKFTSKQTTRQHLDFKPKQQGFSQKAASKCPCQAADLRSANQRGPQTTYCLSARLWAMSQLVPDQQTSCNQQASRLPHRIVLAQPRRQVDQWTCKRPCPNSQPTAPTTQLTVQLTHSITSNCRAS